MCGRGLRQFASRLRAENVNVCFEVGHVTGNVKYIRKSVFQHQNVEGGVLPPNICYLFFLGGEGGGGYGPSCSPCSAAYIRGVLRFEFCVSSYI